MGLIDDLAATRVHVLLVGVPGRPLLRLRAEAAVRARGWVAATSPADADVLLVCGAPEGGLAEAVDRVWAQVPFPRARRTVSEAGAIGGALDSAVRVLADRALQRAAVAEAARPSTAPDALGSRPMPLPPAEDGADGVAGAPQQAPGAAPAAVQRAQLVAGPEAAEEASESRFMSPQSAEGDTNRDSDAPQHERGDGAEHAALQRAQLVAGAEGVEEASVSRSLTPPATRGGTDRDADGEAGQDGGAHAAPAVDAPASGAHAHGAGGHEHPAEMHDHDPQDHDAHEHHGADARDMHERDMHEHASHDHGMHDHGMHEHGMHEHAMHEHGEHHDSDHDAHEHDMHGEHDMHAAHGGGQHDMHAAHGGGQHDMHGHGGHDHHMHMAMDGPGGIPLASGWDDDRDGLEMDVLHLRLGPVLPDWPAGLVVDATLSGDVVVAAEASVLPAADAAAEEDPLGDDERAFVLACDRAVRLLRQAGWDAQALRLTRCLDRVLAGAPAGSQLWAVRRIAGRIARSALLRWGLARTATDARARLLVILGDAERAALGEQPVDDALDPAALAALLPGRGLAEARLLVAAAGGDPVRIEVPHA